MAAPCPICAQASRDELKPFCSKRCAAIDLGRWLNGVYAIPTQDAPGFDDRIDDPQS